MPQSHQAWTADIGVHPRFPGVVGKVSQQWPAGGEVNTGQSGRFENRIREKGRGIFFGSFHAALFFLGFFGSS